MKCQYTAMFMAHPALKSYAKLACVYLDLSEIEGYCFASQKYLRFRTGMSERTITEGNKKIQDLGIFTIKRRPNHSTIVTPDWSVIEREYAKFIEADKKIRAELATGGEFGSAESADPDPQNLQAGSAESAGVISPYNHATSNPPLDSSVPPESKGIYNSRIASRWRNVTAPSGGKNGPSALTGSLNETKTGHHSKPDSSSEKVNQLLSFQRMLMACPKPKEDQEFTDSDIRNAEKGARVRFYKLVRSGVHWRRIETAYANFLDIRRKTGEWPLHLVSFLAKYDEDITSPDCDMYVPPEVGNSDEPVLPEAANDNGLPLRKVSGSDFEDPPF